MKESDSNPPQLPDMPKVYLLPTLMTAGNLICGFMAILQVLEGTLEKEAGGKWIETYEWSLIYILAAFIFDILDGRLARLGGKESAFGREFDSLADVVSFGLAPALLVLKIVLGDLPEDLRWVGYLVAIIYLLGGAMRLARFNIISMRPAHPPSKDFMGFPIPAAAGLVASITLLILTLYRNDKQPGDWKFLLPFLLLFLAFMMYSRITYPNFKTMDWRAKRSPTQVIMTIAVLYLIFRTWRYSLALIFVAYLVYGFIRPWVSKRIRHSIEEEEPDEEEGEGDLNN